MSWTFHPPPGWPLPEGWEPPPGWAPDPSWPPAPDGWRFWQPAPDASLRATAPAEAGARVTARAPVPGPSSPELASPGSGAPGWLDSAPGPGRWLVIAGLAALLLVGSVVGYGGTRIALELAAEPEPAPPAGAVGQPEPSRPGGRSGATPTAQPDGSPAPPAESPDQPAPAEQPVLPSIAVPPGGFGGEVCGGVALAMLAIVAAIADPRQDPEAVIASWRTAADQLRYLAEATGSGPERAALTDLATELDAAAADADPDDWSSLQASLDRLSEAYQRFNDQVC
jgi:hypothetical protein